MREKIQRFMIGRYGADELAKAQSETRPRLLREAAVGNLPQWAKAASSAAVKSQYREDW